MGGGFSVSNYLQGAMGPRRNGYFILAGEILKICEAQVEGDGGRKEKESRRKDSTGSSITIDTKRTCIASKRLVPKHFFYYQYAGYCLTFVLYGSEW